MHHLASTSTKESKLRAACDRCHDLKNRCVRTGGPDSRCDRCERLNIDCVYRTNSRTGRPRRQPPQSTPQPRPAVSSGRVLTANKPPERYPKTTTTTTSRKVHSHSSRQISRQESSDATISTGDSDQNDVDTRNTPGHSLESSTSDVMDIVVSPAGNVHHADLDWSLDFSQHINADIVNNTFNEALFPDTCGENAGALHESEAFSFLESNSSIGQIARDIGTTTDKLLRLQCQLHRLFLTTGQETILDQPAMDEVLEATKSLLEILQASVAAQSCLSEQTLSSASSADGASLSNEQQSRYSNSARRKQTGMSYITVLQALTCYSYVLHVLDPVVSALTSQTADSANGAAELRTSHLNTRLESSSRPALSLGFFNLASQPAMNADVVLHIVLRMIQQLRVSIHTLTSGCRDLADEVWDKLRSPSATNTMLKLHATPIIISSQPVAEIVSEREKLLVERLSCLMNGQ